MNQDPWILMGGARFKMIADRDDQCRKCGNPWRAHAFEVDKKDGPIAYILTDGGERIVCRAKVDLEAAP